MAVWLPVTIGLGADGEGSACAIVTRAIATRLIVSATPLAVSKTRTSAAIAVEVTARESTTLPSPIRHRDWRDTFSTFDDLHCI
jgi:hypothetical protein